MGTARMASRAGWEQVEDGRWRLAAGRCCAEVEASYGWHVETAPGKPLYVGRHSMATLGEAVADAAAFDPAELRGGVRAGLVAEMAAGWPPEFSQEDVDRWTAPLAEGSAYPLVAVSARFYPLLGPAPGGWREGAGPAGRTLEEAMRTCEARLAGHPMGEAM